MCNRWNIYFKNTVFHFILTSKDVDIHQQMAQVDNMSNDSLKLLSRA